MNPQLFSMGLIIWIHLCILFFVKNLYSLSASPTLKMFANNNTSCLDIAISENPGTQWNIENCLNIYLIGQACIMYIQETFLCAWIFFQCTLIFVISFVLHLFRNIGHVHVCCRSYNVNTFNLQLAGPVLQRVNTYFKLYFMFFFKCCVNTLARMSVKKVSYSNYI